MTTRDEDATDDGYWRRPPELIAGPAAPAEPARPAEPEPTYAGPPRAATPPPGWRPRALVQPPPPRQLPPQNLARLDAQERDARTVTYGIGMVAAAVLLVVMFLLCARLLF